MYTPVSKPDMFDPTSSKLPAVTLTPVLTPAPLIANPMIDTLETCTLNPSAVETTAGSPPSPVSEVMTILYPLWVFPVIVMFSLYGPTSCTSTL